MAIANLIVLGVSLGLEIWLLVLLLRRGVRHHFPIFFSYGALLAPVTLARLLTLTNYPIYFMVFWSTDALLLLLGWRLCTRHFAGL